MLLAYLVIAGFFFLTFLFTSLLNSIFQTAGQICRLNSMLPLLPVALLAGASAII